MEPRAIEQSTLIQRGRGKACDYCLLCNHLRKDPDFSGHKTPRGNHDAENCPFCSAEGGIYWEDSEKNPPKEKALRIWRPI